MRSWSAFISIPWRFCFLELVISHKLKWRFVLDVTAWTKEALSLYSPRVATCLRISVKRVEDAIVCDARAMQPNDGRYCCQWVMSVQKNFGVSASLTLGYSSYPLSYVESSHCGRRRVVRECSLCGYCGNFSEVFGRDHITGIGVWTGSYSRQQGNSRHRKFPTKWWVSDGEWEIIADLYLLWKNGNVDRSMSACGVMWSWDHSSSKQCVWCRKGTRSFMDALFYESFLDAAVLLAAYFMN